MNTKLNHIILDWLWQHPDPRFIRLCLSALPSSDYKKALTLDVLCDDPQQAITKLKALVRSPRVSRRLDYLDLRLKSATPTPKLKEITIKHGVHPHFGELEKLIRQHRLKTGAEIGVFMGYHAAHILEACRNLTLFCVDLYDNIQGDGYDDWNSQQFGDLFQTVTRQMSKYHRATFIRLPSLQAAKALKPNSLDFIFLDADHRYPAVKADLRAWEKVVRPGGVISGHDYSHPSWPGVKRAVDEWAKKTSREIHRGQETFWYTYA